MNLIDRLKVLYKERYLELHDIEAWNEAIEDAWPKLAAVFDAVEKVLEDVNYIYDPYEPKNILISESVLNELVDVCKVLGMKHWRTPACRAVEVPPWATHFVEAIQESVSKGNNFGIERFQVIGGYDSAAKCEKCDHDEWDTVYSSGDPEPGYKCKKCGDIQWT